MYYVHMMCRYLNVQVHTYMYTFDRAIMYLSGSNPSNKDMGRKLPLLVESLRGDYIRESPELGLKALDENLIKRFDGVGPMWCKFALMTI